MLLEARLRVRHPGCLADLVPEGAKLVQLSSDRRGGLFFATAEDEETLERFLGALGNDPRFRAHVTGREPRVALVRLVGSLPCPHGEAVAGEGPTHIWPVTYHDGAEFGRALFQDHAGLRAFALRSSVAEIDVESTGHVPLGAVSVSFPVAGIAGALTRRQLDALVSAVQGGYYDIPRSVTTAALARRFEISRTTYDEHLRKGEQALLRQFLQLVAVYPDLGSAARKRPGRPMSLQEARS